MNFVVHECKLKLLYISNSWIPSKSANSIQVVQMCNAFAEVGYDVTLACRDSGLASAAAFDFYGVNHSFEFQFFVARKGLRGSLAYILRLFIFLFKKRYTFGIAYGRFAPGLTIAALLGMPVVLELHAVPSTILRRSAERLLLRCKNLRGLVFISNGLKQEYEKRHRASSKIRSIVAHDGASNYPLASPQRPAPVFGYIGSLYKGKGAEIALSLSKEISEYEFLIVGGTSDEFIELLKGAILPPNLRHVPFRTPSDIGKWLSEIDIGLLPAQSEVTIEGKGNISRWMSPLKLFEYMSAGRAIIASDLPVIREVITHGQNGYLVEPDDLNQWKDAAYALARNPQLRLSLADRARQDFLKDFSWTARVRRIAQILTF